MLVRGEADLPAAGNFVGFPAVLKPVSGAASLGVKKVTSMAEFVGCYREVVKELSGLVVSSGALVKATAAPGGINAGSVVNLTLLLEQYLDGVEVDVDVVMSDGKWQYAAVADNGPTTEPYFNETWGLCPSLLEKEKQSALKDMGVRCVEALGFDTGVFHVELKYTSTGPQLIEVNARMGGGPIRETNRRVWGVDLVEEAMYCGVGVPARPALPKTPNTCIGYSMVNARNSGTVRSTQYFQEIRSRPGVLSSDILVKPGDVVVGPKEGLPTWVAVIIVSGSTPKGALDYVLKLDSDVPDDMLS
jgi:carnosine synthase